MNEDQVYRFMMIAGMALSVIAGLATVGLLVQTAMDYSFARLLASILMAGVSTGFAWGGVHFAQRSTGHAKVFQNAAEREVLTARQRRDLRIARGEVVMQRALIEVENEKDNITHRQLEAANDPEKPPHKTQWTVQETELKRQKQLPEPDDMRLDPRDDGYYGSGGRLY